MLSRELWPLVRSGKKRATIRRRYSVSKGDEILIHAGGNIVGRAKIVRVYKRKMGEIGSEEAEKEGMPLPKLEKILERTYGKDPDQELVVVEFKLLEVFNPPIDLESTYYGDKTPQEIAREALKRNIVEDPFERSILERLGKGGSIREVAFETGGLGKRGIIRRIVRKYGKELESSTS